MVDARKLEAEHLDAVLHHIVIETLTLTTLQEPPRRTILPVNAETPCANPQKLQAADDDSWSAVQTFSSLTGDLLQR